MAEIPERIPWLPWRVVALVHDMLGVIESVGITFWADDHEDDNVEAQDPGEPKGPPCPKSRATIQGKSAEAETGV